MNKSRVVIITLLMFVVAVVLSVFSVEVVPMVVQFQRALTTCKLDLTLHPPFPIRLKHLSRWKCLRSIKMDSHAKRLCSEERNRLTYGCTAFCSDDDPEIDDKSCNHEQKIAYPYGSDSVPNLGIENDYLPDVLSQEMGPAYENVTLRVGSLPCDPSLYSNMKQ